MGSIQGSYAVRLNHQARSSNNINQSCSFWLNQQKPTVAASSSFGERKLVGLGRFELPTPRLSSVCSNQLSYRPVKDAVAPALSKLDRTPPLRQAPTATNARIPRPNSREIISNIRSISSVRYDPQRNVATNRNSSRKEVIQPQVLLQLPCYDFTPITNHTLGACLHCGLARRFLVQPAFVM